MGLRRVYSIDAWVKLCMLHKRLIFLERKGKENQKSYKVSTHHHVRSTWQYVGRRIHPPIEC
ncbi:hypothetical protein M413DRAFT_162078 [Hebeloma cylindrosporum]|uniref:Uncharacterized protein n=1 Tax=Hebeloma cylindrosporum TaxID=76867 RepID=A0A0C2XRW5_HEBCY|nr:hypothetical protein M413DRAFT_162078 [Hebeloma cylindrosporum h7]